MAGALGLRQPSLEAIMLMLCCAPSMQWWRGASGHILAAGEPAPNWGKSVGSKPNHMTPNTGKASVTNMEQPVPSAEMDGGCVCAYLPGRDAECRGRCAGRADRGEAGA